MRRYIVIPSAALAAVLVCTSPVSAVPKSGERANEKSCREAANGLISLLDADADNTPLYRDTFAVVVNSCGPATSTPQTMSKPPTPPPSRDACHDLAAALVDLIEDGKMNSPAFVTARNDFALTCPPR
jgi:hypothetical protein